MTAAYRVRRIVARILAYGELSPRAYASWRASTAQTTPPGVMGVAVLYSLCKYGLPNLEMAMSRIVAALCAASILAAVPAYAAAPVLSEVDSTASNGRTAVILIHGWTGANET